jgi:hypothetical protein
LTPICLHDMTRKLGQRTALRTRIRGGLDEERGRARGRRRPRPPLPCILLLFLHFPTSRPQITSRISKIRKNTKAKETRTQTTQTTGRPCPRRHTTCCAACMRVCARKYVSICVCGSENKTKSKGRTRTRRGGRESGKRERQGKAREGAIRAPSLVMSPKSHIFASAPSIGSLFPASPPSLATRHIVPRTAPSLPQIVSSPP